MGVGWLARSCTLERNDIQKRLQRGCHPEVHCCHWQNRKLRLEGRVSEEMGVAGQRAGAESLAASLLLLLVCIQGLILKYFFLYFFFPFFPYSITHSSNHMATRGRRLVVIY